jgi:AraC-like DNA-binding protein
MTSAGADLETIHFVSEDLSSEMRVPSWRGFLGRSVVKLAFGPLSGRGHANLTVRRLPGLTIMSGVSGGLRTWRTRELIADGNDDLILRLHFSGRTEIWHRNREMSVGNGAVLLSLADVGTVNIPANARYVALRLPRKALAALAPRIDDAVMRPLPGDTEALQLLTAYVSGLNGQALSTPEIRHLFVTHVTDLAALVIGATRDAAAIAEGRGVRVARLRAIKADIANRLGSQELNVTAVAARQRISARYLQMLFEEKGTTFSRYLLEQRLARAHRMLTDPRYVGWTVTAIAFHVGFGDLSHFNHAFRRFYAASPSDMREMARREYQGTH